MDQYDRVLACYRDSGGLGQDRIFDRRRRTTRTSSTSEGGGSGGGHHILVMCENQVSGGGEHFGNSIYFRTYFYSIYLII
jgi:hypothetical protein